MEHTLTPNKPPKFPGYYFFIDLRDGTLDIVSVFEAYKGKKVLQYAFFNDEKIYSEDDVLSKLHFNYCCITIPEELAEQSLSYMRFLNAKKDSEEVESSSEFESCQKVLVWDDSKKYHAIYIGKNDTESVYKYAAIRKGHWCVQYWKHCEACEW